MHIVPLLVLLGASVYPLSGQTGVRSFLHNFPTHRGNFRVTIAVPDASAGPRCEIVGAREIKVTCTYTPTPRSLTSSQDETRLVLNRAMLTFDTIREGYMFVDLTLTNEGARSISGQRLVSLAVDDEAGLNMVRRVLPTVDFSKLVPGTPVAFSERLLIGGFLPGRYKVSLLLRNPDPSLKDDPARNILLSDEGVADPSTGSNTIAHFTVGPPSDSFPK